MVVAKSDETCRLRQIAGYPDPVREPAQFGRYLRARPWMHKELRMRRLRREALSPPRRSQRHRPGGPSQPGPALSPRPVRLCPTFASSSRSPSPRRYARAPGCRRPRRSSLRNSQNAGLPHAGKYRPPVGHYAVRCSPKSPSTPGRRKPQLPDLVKFAKRHCSRASTALKALAQAVRPVSVQSGDLCSEARQRTGSAECSRPR